MACTNHVSIQFEIGRILITQLELSRVLEMTGVDSQEYTVLVSEGEWSDWESVVRSAKIFDLIEIDRNGVYQHWVMYLSKGFIVHVTQVDGRTEGDKAEKRVDTLKAIAREDKCRINNLRDAAKAKGLDVNSNYEIYKLIEDVAGFDHELVNLPKNHYKIMPYNVYSNNCEYYATEWKYGKGFSLQVEKRIKKILLVAMVICDNGANRVTF